jgi:hypothetical protein
MPYLLVDGGVGGGALVDGVVVSDDGLQPVNKAPITSPISTIRVYILFIGTRTLSPFPKKRKQNLLLFSGIVFAR